MGRQSFEQSGDVVRERLQWSLSVGGRSHTLNILPAPFGGSVSIELDGRTVMRLSKPKPQRPWQEAALEINGEPVTVALIWNRPIMRTDVFVAARSLIDGRTIDQARQSAPSPLSDYEVWIGGYFGNAIPPRRPLLPPRFALVALAALIALVGLFALVPRPSGLGAGAVVGVALVTLAVIWFRSWFVVLDRAHVHLLSHPELGDVGRQVRFFAAFIGYALASGAIVTAILIVLSR
jgi:hypothetical protein